MIRRCAGLHDTTQRYDVSMRYDQKEQYCKRYGKKSVELQRLLKKELRTVKFTLFFVFGIEGSFFKSFIKNRFTFLYSVLLQKIKKKSIKNIYYDIILILKGFSFFHLHRLLAFA